MVEDIFLNICQPKNIDWPNESANKEIQVEHICLDINPQTPTLCLEDDLIDQSIYNIPNSIILEPNRQIQLQDHGASQFLHSYTYNDETNYARKYDVDLYSPLYDRVFYYDEWTNPREI